MGSDDSELWAHHPHVMRMQVRGSATRPRVGMTVPRLHVPAGDECGPGQSHPHQHHHDHSLWTIWDTAHTPGAGSCWPAPPLKALAAAGRRRGRQRRQSSQSHRSCCLTGRKAGEAGGQPPRAEDVSGARRAVAREVAKEAGDGLAGLETSPQEHRWARRGS